MILCQLQWHRRCDVNVRAVTGLLTSNHNALHPCIISLPQRCVSPRVWEIPQAPTALGLHGTLNPPCRDWVAVASICFLSCSLGSSTASCPLLAPGKWVWCADRQAVCLQRQQTPSHLKVHLSLEHGCSNHCDDSTKIVAEFLLSCYLNSTRSTLIYTLGQCFPYQKCCENPSGPWSQMTSISFFEKKNEMHWNRIWEYQRAFCAVLFHGTFAPWICFYVRSALIYCCSCNKLPNSLRLKITQIFYLLVL